MTMEERIYERDEFKSGVKMKDRGIDGESKGADMRTMR